MKSLVFLIVFLSFSSTTTEASLNSNLEFEDLDCHITIPILECQIGDEKIFQWVRIDDFITLIKYLTNIERFVRNVTREDKQSLESKKF